MDRGEVNHLGDLLVEKGIQKGAKRTRLKDSGTTNPRVEVTKESVIIAAKSGIKRMSVLNGDRGGYKRWRTTPKKNDVSELGRIWNLGALESVANSTSCFAKMAELEDELSEIDDMKIVTNNVKNLEDVNKEKLVEDIGGPWRTVPRRAQGKTPSNLKDFSCVDGPTGGDRGVQQIARGRFAPGAGGNVVEEEAPPPPAPLGDGLGRAAFTRKNGGKMPRVVRWAKPNQNLFFKGEWGLCNDSCDCHKVGGPRRRTC